MSNGAMAAVIKLCKPLLVAVAFSVGILAAGLVAPAAAQNQPKDEYILRGSPLGAVKFEHKLHTQRAADKCDTCHHPSRPERPATAQQQPCFECHTTPPQPGMKTNRQGAFHSPTAQSGSCIDCHKAVNAKSGKAPVTCMTCHRKENG